MTEDPDSSSTTTSTWLNRLSQALLREPQDREQLVELLRDAEQRELLDAEALAMIEGVLQVSEMQVRDIMIPRAQMIVVEKHQAFTEFLPNVIESTHSRFPVVGESLDEVAGILHAKDLLPFTGNGAQDFTIETVLRPAIFVPESKRLDVLLKDFRNKHNHMAIVVDEYGGVSGLVTIEDVLEQIVGEIEDEFDTEEEPPIKQLSAKQFNIKALTSIEDFNEYFDTSFSDEEFDTIGGFITNALGHMPKREETITIDNCEFKILHADKRRVHLLQVTCLPEEEDLK